MHTLGVDRIEAVADRGYFKIEDIVIAWLRQPGCDRDCSALHHIFRALRRTTCPFSGAHLGKAGFCDLSGDHSGQDAVRLGQVISSSMLGS